MRVYCTGTAVIEHCETGEIYKIDSSELDWDQTSGDERDMGTEILHQALIEHRALGTLCWEIWEYPEGYQNYNYTAVGQHKLLEDLKYNLEQEDWTDYPTPDQPLDVFMTSYNETVELLRQPVGPTSRQLMNRLVFAHQFTALEAYLGDTLINGAMSDKDAFLRLIKDEATLKDNKYSLLEISNNPGIVESEVKKHLRSVLYHNIPKANALYKIAFGVNILDFIKDKDKLFQSVNLRHDCVHRNGFDNDGRELDIFTEEFVLDIANLIKELVTAIDKKIDEMTPF